MMKLVIRAIDVLALGLYCSTQAMGFLVILGITTCILFGYELNELVK